MKATLLGFGVLLAALGMVAPASAQQPAPQGQPASQGQPAPQGYPVYQVPMRPQAPDMCGPGYYNANRCGQVYGPNYCVYPPFPPYSGMGPNMNMGGAQFPVHPFARSPRDFFMYGE